MKTLPADDATGLRPRLLRALGHPLRQQILKLLNEREASPSQLAAELNVALPKLAYHVRILLDNDAIELTRTRPVRGAVEHFYRAIMRPQLNEEHWSALPPSVRMALFDQTIQQIWDHVVEGVDGGGFEADDAHVSWTTIELDQDARDEATALLEQMVGRLLELQAETAGRLVELPAEQREASRIEVAALLFDRPANA